MLRLIAAFSAGRPNASNHLMASSRTNGRCAVSRKDMAASLMRNISSFWDQYPRGRVHHGPTSPAIFSLYSMVYIFQFALTCILFIKKFLRHQGRRFLRGTTLVAHL